ncbi:MAG: MYXO-CTERM sorting domain-containing protein [Myxococcota bacterium]
MQGGGGGLGFVVAVAVAAALFPDVAAADTVLRFEATTAGNIVATGNTLGLAKQADANGPGIEDSIGTFTSLDNTTDLFPLGGLNSWFSGTTGVWFENGSDAELRLPDYDVEILHAELVWGASWAYGEENVQASLNQPVVFSFGGDQTTAAPDPTTALTFDTTSTEGFAIKYYLRSADVTDFVRDHGAGMYATQSVPATQDTMTNALNAAGWSLLVAYRSSQEPIRNLSIFVGGEFVDENSVVDYSVAGFCAPPSGTFEGFAAISALEGDADREGDFLTIAETEAGPFVPLSGPNNPEDNFFCSQLNDADGQLDAAGTFGDRNHNAVAGNNVVGGRQGWDVTTVCVSSAEGHLQAGQTAAVLRTETVGDSYLPTAAGLAIEINAPDFANSEGEIEPAVADLDDVLTAVLSIDNAGPADATSLRFSTTLPDGIELLSIDVDGDELAVDAAALETGVDVGDVPAGSGRTVTLKMRAVDVPENGESWHILPRWEYDYISCAGEAPLSEPHSAPALSVDYSGAAGADDDGGTGDDGADGDGSGDGDGDDGDDDDSVGDTDGVGPGIPFDGVGRGTDSGCSCRSSNGSVPPASLWLGFIVLLARRRR